MEQKGVDVGGDQSGQGVERGEAGGRDKRTNNVGSECHGTDKSREMDIP